MTALYYISKTNTVSTPPYLLKILTKEFGPMFDPCPFNPKFNKKTDVDGLKIAWKQTNYVNPPYSCAKPWVTKAKREQDNGKTSILLLKLTTLGTQYMNACAPTAELRVFSHPLIFPGYNGIARFTNVLIIFHADKRNAGQISFITHLPPKQVEKDITHLPPSVDTNHVTV